MPRRTRRSEEPSAAVQPDNDSVDTAASTENADSASGEKPPAARIRPASSRTRIAPKPIVLNADGSIDETEAVAPTDKPARRRPPRRVVRVPKADESIVAGTELSEPGTDVTPDVSEKGDARSGTRQTPPLRRRVGGRRSPSEAANAAAEPSVTEPLSTSEPPTTPSSGRSRRRRGNKRPEAAEAIAAAPVEAADFDDTLILDLALDSETAVEDISGTEEERKRPRRSRRGGRRRSGKSSEVEGSEDAEAETGDVEADDIAGLLPVYIAPPPFKAPALVPSPQDLDLKQVDLRTTAQLADDASGFVVNGNYYPPELFFVNAETAEDPNVVKEEITLAASHGIHLHSGVAYLPLKNAYGVRSFGSIQSLIKQVTEADPEGFVFVRLQLVPTNFWARMHPEEMAVYSDGSNGDVSFASRTFWQDAVDALGALIEFLADSDTPGGDRVIGLHLDKGEWFNDANAGYDFSAPNKIAFQNWLHEHYQNPFALRAAWFSGTAQFDSAEIPKWPGSPANRKREEVVLYNRPKERRTVDYNAFTSYQMAQAITGVADAIKWLSNGKLLVGASYGYTFEFATRNDSGHQALSRVLQSPSIDVVAGPNSYATRQAGAAGSFSSPIDSARLHGKLWLIEDDTKTYLAADETEDAFNPKVSTIQDTVSVLRRNASAAYVHGCGISWMDLWGNGWLNSPEIWSEIAQLRSQGTLTRRLQSAVNAVPEVAILVDEASYNYVCGDPSGVALQSGLINKSRELIYRSGASVGYYLQSDVGLLPDEIKLYIFLNPLRVTTQERQAIREKLQKPGKTLAWLYAPGLFDERGDSPTEVSEIVGMPLKAQAWNSHIGTIFTEERHPVTERLHGGKRLGSDEVLNPSFAVADPAAIVLGEYSQSGAPSIASKINEPGWKSVFIGEPHLTGELLRGLYRFAGVHVYDVQDDIIHAGASGVLLVHSPYTGQRTIHLPRPVAVYSVYEHRLITQHASTFRSFMRGRSTNFFLWGDIDVIATALGTTADELRQQQAAWKAERENSQQRNNRDQQRENSSVDSDSDNEYGSNDDEDAPQELPSGTENDEGVEEVVERVIVAPAAVSALVRSGLIAGDIDLADVEFEEDGLDEVTPVADASPARTEPMSPSRRRRWNRKRNMQAAKNPAPPSISMEDLLSDLPPRKPSPPKSPEQNG